MSPRNFGRDAHRASRRATERAFQAVEDERWTIPDDMVTEESVERWVDQPDVRVTNRTVREVGSGRIVDYAFIHEMQVGNEWCTVAKIDCAHDEVHRHVPPRDAEGKLHRSTIRVIKSRADVEETYQTSLDEIYDDLESNEREWRHGR